MAAPQHHDQGERDVAARLVGGLRSVIDDDRPFVASPKLRLTYLAVAAATLGLWVASLIPAIQGWNNPNEDGFSFIPVFYASITVLPAGLYLLAGAVVGRGKWASRARKALSVGVALLFIVVAFWIFQFIANNTGG